MNTGKIMNDFIWKSYVENDLTSLIRTTSVENFNCLFSNLNKTEEFNFSNKTFVPQETIILNFKEDLLISLNEKNLLYEELQTFEEIPISISLYPKKQKARHQETYLKEYIDHIGTGIITEIKKQHETTRKTVEYETEKIKNDLISYIKANPVSTLDLFSKWGLLFGMFCLVVQAISGILIMNPWFCLLIIFSSLSTIVMCKTTKRKQQMNDY